MSTFDKLDEVFDMPSEIIQTEDTIEKNTVDPKTKEDITKDYDYTRGQLYDLIEKGQEAIQGALDVAQNTDHPRAYEVAIQGIKNVADITDKLIDLQKKMKDIDEKPRKGPTSVTNALFVGSTAELQKLIKQQKVSEDK